MLSKEWQLWKALIPMALTESGIATVSTWLQSWKAPVGISVREEGMLTWRRPSAWIVSFVAASTSFLWYITVTSDSSFNSPADSTVWSSSTSNPSARTFTLRILRSMGSSQGFFSWSTAFNSSMVLVGMTSTVRSPPSKVFIFTSRSMAAIFGQQNRRRSKGVDPNWCEEISTAFLPLVAKMQKWCDKDGDLLTLRHIHQFSMQLLRNLKEVAFWGEPFTTLLKPTKNTGFFWTLAGLVLMLCPVFFSVFSAVESLNCSKSSDHKQLSKHQSPDCAHLILPTLEKINLSTGLPGIYM